MKIGSAGKIFSLTGWKVGFVCAAPKVLQVLAKAHQYITFTTPPNLQAAVAHGLMKEDAYFTGMRADFQRSRDPAGGWPAHARLRRAAGGRDLFPQHRHHADGLFRRRDLLEASGDDARRGNDPVSAFYAENHVKNVVRFCFAKKDATIDGALERLEGMVRGVGGSAGVVRPSRLASLAPQDE